MVGELLPVQGAGAVRGKRFSGRATAESLKRLDAVIDSLGVVDSRWMMAVIAGGGRKSVKLAALRNPKGRR